MILMGQVNRFRLEPLLRAVATGLGTGFFPVAPGTAGTLLALPLWYLTGGGAPHLLLLALVLAVAVPAARAEIARTGREDPPTVVIDEVAGMLVATAGIPWGLRQAVILFLLFRFFDVVKFGPAAWLNRKQGPFFVIADDLAAGLYVQVAWRGVAWAVG